MRRTATMLLVGFQIVVLAFMAGQREYIVRYGQTVHLRTAPVDPRDIFRGDFVRLDYELSRVDTSLVTLSQSPAKYGQKVFASLSPILGDLFELTQLTDVAPEQGLYMRGRVLRHPNSISIPVKYGIEQFFVEQGSGIDIEKRRGNRQSLQIPMEVAVALSDSGVAVIKGYRWSKLGMQLEVTRLAQRNNTTNLDEVEGPLSPKLKLTLKNVSEVPLALVNPGDNCGFEIIPSNGVSTGFASAYQGCANVSPGNSDVMELAPGQEQIYELDLSEPRWHVIDPKGKTDEIGRLTDWERFRIVYRAPDASVLAGLTASENVWLGYLPSRAFTAVGRID